MTESQARQTFTAAQTKLQKALTEFNEAQSALETITGCRAPMNTQLSHTFSQTAGGAGAALQAEF